MTTTNTIIEADLTWIDDGFRAGVRVAIDAGGVIEAVGNLEEPPTTRLERRALLPGFVNAHSHAFQRGLRGCGERFGDGTGPGVAAGDFWSWREAMYTLVGAMDADRLYDLCVQAYREMRAAGITTVGEFHYLHHDASGGGYAFDEVVLRAAKSVGIRVALLEAYYRTGGIDEPLGPEQGRFRVDSADEYWAQIDRLADAIDPATQSLGAVAHSIRAAGIDEIAALHEEAERRAMVFHMHVEEQPREIEACVHRYHRPPLALLSERLTVTPRMTAVHCTHSAPEDMADFLQAGGNVCICPLTEANLGDGLADVRHIGRHYGRVCLGTDSNARLSMLEEMRWLEYGQRLRTLSRGVCVDPGGQVARSLLKSATVNGALALGLRTGEIAVGRCADFALIDLDAPDLVGWTAETLLESIVFGAGNTCIAGTLVGGA